MIYFVAPRVGAWIETPRNNTTIRRFSRSHPVWVRGLKRMRYDLTPQNVCRTPCGCVD